MKGEPDLERNRLKLGPALERKRPKRNHREVLDIPQSRFLKHIWANLKEKEKKKLVAADEKAKERLAATGRTWLKVKYTIEDKSIESLVVEVKSYKILKICPPP